MRPSVRSEAVLPAERVQAASHGGAHSGEHTGVGSLGLHRRDPRLVRAGPGDRGGGRDLHPVADPGAVPVRGAAVPRPVPADAEPGGARDAELRRHRAVPPGRLLAAGARARAGQQRRRARQRHLLPRQPRLPRALRPPLAVLQVQLDGVLRRGVPWRPRLPQARRAVRRHGLVSFHFSLPGCINSCAS